MVAVAVLMTVLYLVFRKVKKLHIYYVCFILASAGFICCYIHANFLAGMLPPLDGTEFDWGGVGRNLVSILVVLLLLGAAIFGIIKYKPEKTAKMAGYANLAVLAMLGVGLIATLLTTAVFEPKEVATVSSTKNINLVSTKENYFVLLLDAVDAKTFEEVLLEDGAETGELKDFSFFVDSLSGYPFTRDSIPFIFSGAWNENEKPFAEYSTEAFDNAKFFDKLTDEGYTVKNFYDNDFIWRSREAFEFNNIESMDKSYKMGHFLKQEIKYLLFKVLPFPLKRFSKIAQMNFNRSRAETRYEAFIWDDTKFYHETLEKPVEKTDEKVFSYIHLEGSHVPLNLDKDVNVVDGGTDYRTKTEASLTVVKGFINYLKAAGVYDNATIVILADHGYNADGGVAGRQNPLLMVKGANETHSKMHVSEKQVSYADIAGMFEELLDGKRSTEVLENVAESGRERRYLYYVYNYEDHMIEQTLNGKAWETEKMVPTGKEYNL